MQFDIITIFPKIFDSYFKESIIQRAQKAKTIKIKIHNLRDFTSDRHKTVDDRPFGGGIGMVMKAGPIYKAISKIKKKGGKVILFTPRGKKFDQRTAYKLSKIKQIILICGRYEGIDERVRKIVDMEVSIGEYVLMGGEIPAMVVVESVSRLIPGVLGKKELLKERITEGKGFVEYPQYTRPEIFKKWKVPKVLLSGNHKEIDKWRKKRAKLIEK